MAAIGLTAANQVARVFGLSARPSILCAAAIILADVVADHRLDDIVSRDRTDSRAARSPQFEAPASFDSPRRTSSGRKPTSPNTLLGSSERGAAAVESGATPTWRMAAPGGVISSAELLEMAPTAFYEVATFYTMFNLRPVRTVSAAGLHHDPCWLLGRSSGQHGVKQSSASRRRENAGRSLYARRGRVSGGFASPNAPVLHVKQTDFYEDRSTSRQQNSAHACAPGISPTGSGHLLHVPSRSAVAAP